MSFSYSDSVVPQPIIDSINALSSARSAFYGTGVAIIEEADGAGAGGNFTKRRYGAEDSTAGIPIDGTAQTPEILNAVADVAPVLRRMRFRRAVDGAGAAEGGALAINPTQRIIDSTAYWWAAEWDRAILAELAAAFHASGPLYSTHVSDIAVGTGAVVPLSFSAVISASTLIGDRFRDLGVLVAHSAVAADLYREAGARPLAAPVSGAPFMTDVYVGNLRLVVSDRCPVSGTGTYAKYTSFALAQGAVWSVEQQTIREFVQLNAAIPSTDYTQSWHKSIGLSGLSAGATMPVNPADSDLDDYGKWDLTVSPMTDASRKSIGVVGIITNAG